MKLRWPLIGVGLLAIGGGLYLWLGSSDSNADSAQNSRSGKFKAVAMKDGKPLKKIELKPPVQMVMTESGLKPIRQRKPRTAIDPRNGSTIREIVDSVNDPAELAREELTFRMRRLRLVLSDEAASCYKGGDGKEEIELDYTLVVENEVIRTENVRVAKSGLKDATVERCIIEAVRDLRGFAENVTDMREEQGLTMSLHDLYVRNRGASGDKSVEQREATDLDDVKTPGSK
jgi:hypothetical protein